MRVHLLGVRGSTPAPGCARSLPCSAASPSTARSCSATCTGTTPTGSPSARRSTTPSRGSGSSRRSSQAGPSTRCWSRRCPRRTSRSGPATSAGPGRGRRWSRGSWRGELHDAALALADGVDVLLHDAQYTAEELPTRGAYGHSAAEYAVALGEAAGARRVVLFHHDPARTDDEVDAIVARFAGAAVPVTAAVEGAALDL